MDQRRYGCVDPDASLGKRGEQAAARHLRKKGLRILAESESDKAGEIDLIAVCPKDRLVIFVEVKTLASTKPGHPAERVNEEKQKRLTRAALRYLKRNHIIGAACRFDVVAVWWPEQQLPPTRIEHYEAAFEAALKHQMI
ncbi:MAG: YraN family protein [Planctomycetota bacterium]